MLDLREFQTIQNLSVADRFIAGNYPFVPMLQAHILCDSLGSRALGVK